MDRYRSRKPSWSTHHEHRSAGLFGQGIGWATTTAQRMSRQTRAFTAAFAERPRENLQHAFQQISRRIFSVPNLLILIWLLALYRNEFTVFDRAIRACEWSSWERWPDHAVPHHVAIITDPQLVDPHTYPGRPWPLSTLTVKHTDLYLRRSYSRIQRNLDPYTVFFLGDLFDGGREWSTSSSQSPEDRWRKYGNDYWVKEYRRFGRIFFKDWNDREDTLSAAEPDTSSPRVVASLPGNHDLGFGGGIQIPVRDRFQAFFGDSNRVDIIGNHTFVSLDTVSLSAEEQQGADENIWVAPKIFLQDAKDTMREEVDKYVRNLGPKPPGNERRQHIVEETSLELPEHRAAFKDPPQPADFPAILLTHVPLFRAQGTPCGPLRERWPPTPPPPGQKEPVDPDNRNSLTIDHGWGYQYQNFISQGLSKFILEELEGKIGHVFSGDDHDYCEVVHKAYPNPGQGIREITVKSISWAMGVRRPGFVLVSLWNEVDESGKRIRRDSADDTGTIQTHLCLLPDQLSIFMTYAWLFGFTVVILAANAGYKAFAPSRASGRQNMVPVLPLSDINGSSAEREKANGLRYPQTNGRVSRVAESSSLPHQSADGLSVTRGRSGTATRPRSISPMPTYGYGIGNAALDSTNSHYYPHNSQNGSAKKPDRQWNEKDQTKDHVLSDRSRSSRVRVIWSETWRGLWKVVRIALPWYIWLWYKVK